MKNYITRYKRHEGKLLCESKEGIIDLTDYMDKDSSSKILYKADTYFIMKDCKIEIFNSRYELQYELVSTKLINTFNTNGKETIYNDDDTIYIANIMKTRRYEIPDLLKENEMKKIELLSGKRIGIFANKNITIYSYELNATELKYESKISNIDCFSWDESINLFICARDEMIYFYEPNGLQHNENYHLQDIINKELSYINYENINISIPKESLSKKEGRIKRIFKQKDLILVVAEKIYLLYFLNYKLYFKYSMDIFSEVISPEINLDKNKLFLKENNYAYEIFFISEIACYNNKLILSDRETLYTNLEENIMPLPMYEKSINIHAKSICSINNQFALLNNSDLFLNNERYDLEESFDEVFFFNNNLYLRKGNIIFLNNNIVSFPLELKDNEKIIKVFTTKDKAIFITDYSRVIDGDKSINISCEISLRFSYFEQNYLIHVDNSILFMHINDQEYLLNGIKSCMFYENRLICIARNQIIIFEYELATHNEETKTIDFSKRRDLQQLLKSKCITIINDIGLSLKLNIIHAQELFEISEIISIFNYQIVLFIERGNFETLYPKILQKEKIKKKIHNKLALKNLNDNFNEIFNDLKKVQIPFNFLKTFEKKEIFKIILLNSEDKYKLEYFKNEMLSRDVSLNYKQQKTIKQHLFDPLKPTENHLEEEVELILNFIEKSPPESIPIYLIFANLFSFALIYTVNKNKLQNIKTIRKYLNDNLIFKYALLTYDLKVINQISKLLSKNISFSYESWMLRYKINEFLENYEEALFWIDDVVLEKEFIKEKNLFEISLKCEFKEETHECINECEYLEYHEILKEKRTKNFYKKFYAKNTTSEKALQLSLECKDIEMSLKYALNISEIDVICNLLNLKMHKGIITTLINKLEERDKFNELGNFYLRRGELAKSIEYKLRANKYSDVLICLKVDKERLVKYTERNPWSNNKHITMKERLHIFDVEKGDYLNPEEREAVYECLINLIKKDFENAKTEILEVLEKFKNYFKKFDSLKEFVDADDMSISTVSSISQIKGLKGIKKKLMRLKIKETDLLSRFLCIHDICINPKHKELLEHERNELIAFNNKFAKAEIKCREIMEEREEDFCLKN